MRRTITLYPFRYISDRTGKWVKARYVASLDEIKARHKPGEWEIAGEPELRTIDDDERYFNPVPGTTERK